ncbi:hypothetical protein [Azohydromonas aeria]|uniref:hypothetical protein n=1 Tax=Azohydromonas aeria TaxID=2590212 RepID=UPI0012F91EE9|nr:hypothetical protein [Azohydromonas aeria]
MSVMLSESFLHRHDDPLTRAGCNLSCPGLLNVRHAIIDAAAASKGLRSKMGCHYGSNGRIAAWQCPAQSCSSKAKTGGMIGPIQEPVTCAEETA